MKEVDNFYWTQAEPLRGLLLAIREIILSADDDITTTMKYGMPFFCYKGKMFCYLWYHKKYKKPYLGIVEGKRFDEAFLLQEGRSRMKIMLFETTENLPLPEIKGILKKAISLYMSGEIAVRNK